MSYYEYGMDQQTMRPEGRQPMVFDGKRMRKPISRKFVDYSSTILNYIHKEKFQRSIGQEPVYFPPHGAYVMKMLPTSALEDNPASSITTKFAHASTNKNRCPINVVTWTPEGRRLITGATTGEFTLWNGMAFNFETIQQAHDTPVRSMVWSHNDTFMVTADNGGVIKYWQSNMNNLKAFEGHKECIRDLSFSASDLKFASCSDDGTVKIWDFEAVKVDKELTGHGSDVKTCDWHPLTSLIASGAKDYLVKLWDARSGNNVVTLHGHKNTIFRVRWNRNGNWLLTCGRDQLIKLYDIRTMKDLNTFRGHKKEVTSLAWHPFDEGLFASGGYEGSMLFWLVGNEVPQGKIHNAHDGTVWDLAWHPMGHILCSGSADQTTKFWIRNRPGDKMKDKYNISQLPEGSATQEEIEMLTSTKKGGKQQNERGDRQQGSDRQQPSSFPQQTAPAPSTGPKVIPGFGSNIPSNLVAFKTPDGEQMIYPSTRSASTPQFPPGIAPPPGMGIPGMFPPGFGAPPPGIPGMFAPPGLAPPGFPPGFDPNKKK